MGVDLGNLLNGPVQTVLGRAVLIEPRASVSLEAPAYAARGIFMSVPVDVMMDGGGVVSEQRTTLEINTRDKKPDGSGPMYPAPLKQGDRVSVDGGATWYRVATTDDDGEGNRTLVLSVWIDGDDDD